LGVGTTGQAVIDYCLTLMGCGEGRVVSLTIYPGSAAPPELPDDPRIQVHPAIQTVRGSYDLTIVSPGIPPTSELYRSAQSCSRELISEPEFAYRESPDHWLAVTGTNGKTTTTALLTHLLTVAGWKARAVGNIGTPCISAVAQRQPGEWLVAELSSYQLASTRLFAPEAAILLNITPDHLSWHGSLTEYAQAKELVFANMAPGSPRIIDATAAETRALVKRFRAKGQRVIPLGTAEGLWGDMTTRCGALEAAFVESTSSLLTVVCAGQRHGLLPAAELQIKGSHNQQNALAAAAAALAIGVSLAAVREGLATFRPLEHRIEPSGTVCGVHFFNDSKATNPEATIKALSAFDDLPVVLMLGGRDKGTELTELVAACEDSCRAVVCYGEAGRRLYAAFNDHPRPERQRLKHIAFKSRSRSNVCIARFSGCLQLTGAFPEVALAGDFRQAFDAAVGLAQAGDVLLLSPACASFDEFDSYEHRGAVFKALVQGLGAEDGTDR
jgi:UDP-N-acetylmuramoylalanine--D-glutamate ligase